MLLLNNTTFLLKNAPLEQFDILNLSFFSLAFFLAEYAHMLLMSIYTVILFLPGANCDSLEQLPLAVSSYSILEGLIQFYPIMVIVFLIALLFYTMIHTTTNFIFFSSSASTSSGSASPSGSSGSGGNNNPDKDWWWYLKQVTYIILGSATVIIIGYVVYSYCYQTQTPMPIFDLATFFKNNQHLSQSDFVKALSLEAKRCGLTAAQFNELIKAVCSSNPVGANKGAVQIPIVDLTQVVTDINSSSVNKGAIQIPIFDLSKFMEANSHLSEQDKFPLLRAELKRCGVTLEQYRDMKAAYRAANPKL